ncbi:hypothetical protein [Prosthecobacter sp.]|jgi:hypothetical protein|uniref:hypothetical protein n=1 Tax=Prosthecobacter sp. TaxID=1965333 RepID=UPI0037848253
MNTHLLSERWLGVVEHAVLNASDLRVALNEAVRAIGEQIDATASMDLEYKWFKSRRELAQVLSSEAEDDCCHACWSLVEAIMDLHDRSDPLDNMTFEKEFESVIQIFPQEDLGENSPSNHLWTKLLVGCLVFVQAWSICEVEG